MSSPAQADNWEGGTRDRHGRRWLHVPHDGWRLAGRQPYLKLRLTWRGRLLRWLSWR